MRISAIPPESQATLPWRNGGGITCEILRRGPEQAFIWRASIAQIHSSGPFSAFVGYQRSSCLIDGGPLLLRCADRNIALEPRLRAFVYPGAPPPLAELTGPFASVFNLISDEQRVHAQLLPRPLVGSMVFFDQADTDWLVYLLSGEAELRIGEQRHWMGSRHGLLLEGETSGKRAVLEGGGELVLAKIVRL